MMALTGVAAVDMHRTVAPFSLLLFPIHGPGAQAKSRKRY